MRRFLLVRTVRAFLTAFVVVTVTFVVLRITGDPVQTLVPMELQTPEVLARYRELWGLDRPLPVQYLAYLRGILHGEFGTSFADGRPAFAVIAEKVGGTLLLTVPAFLAMLAIGLPAGVAAALNRGGRTDRAVMAFAVAGHSLPGYLLGILLIWLLAVEWRVLPSSGSTTWRHMVMPVLTLALYNGATVARFTRAAVLDVIERPHVRAARAQGWSERAVLFRDILPNAAIPLVTVLGLTLGGLIGGAIVVEWIFAWPGIGRLLVDSVSGRDLAVVQGLVLIFSASMILANFLTDLAYALLNPRLRITG